MPNGILEVKQIKQLSADGGGTVVDVENKTITANNVRANSFTDLAGTGAPDFPNGFTSNLPEGSISNYLFTKIAPSGGAVTTAPYEATSFGSHTHTCKRTNTTLIIRCKASVQLYQNGGATDQRANFALRSDDDSYVANIDEVKFGRYLSGAIDNSLHGVIELTAKLNLTNAVDDTRTFKIYVISYAGAAALNTNNTANGGTTWESFEVEQ